MLMNSKICEVVESRPLDGKRWERDATRTIGGFFDGLSLGSIKQSGPSPGEGHKFTQTQTLGGIKDSGPSPGVGHSFTNARTFGGGIKDSHPSPSDQGHNYNSGNHQ